MGSNQRLDPIEEQEQEEKERKDKDIQQMRLDLLRRQRGSGETLG